MYNEFLQINRKKMNNLRENRQNTCKGNLSKYKKPINKLKNKKLCNQRCNLK